MSNTIERMSRVDTAWLRMDSPGNLMMIVGVWILRPRLSYEDLCARVGDTLLRYHRFKQKVVEDPMGAAWVDDRRFDIHRHVQRETLAVAPGHSFEQALQARVGELAATPLDPKHPLWEFRLVEAFDGPHGNRSALISRIHHCIGDGIALISVMLSICDGGKPPPVRARKQDSEDEPDWLSDALVKPLTDLAVKAIGMYGQGVGKSMQMLAGASNPMSGSIEMARVGFQLINDVAALALMPDDSPTRLKGKATPGKKVAWGEPMPLDRVKAIGRALGCSINDVLLASVAGAIGDYLQRKGDDPSGQEIRAMVPVNLRPIAQAHKLGNHFGMVPLVLPIGIANPVERVYAVQARMNALKGSYQPLLAFGVLAVSGLLVKPAQAAITNLFAKKTTAVMTNVPGPKQPLAFCGRTVEQIMFWVPASGDIGVGVSILSYGAGVQFGLITDAKLCPDPERIVERFAPEFDKLLMLTMMLPWAAAA
jgi:diacylglycerol O-acyltransferase / wax synthase